MKLSLLVDGMYFNTAVSVEVPEVLIQAFRPINVSDEPDIFDEIEEGGKEHEVCMQFREGAAKELSCALTKLIFDEMKKRDTLNRY